MLSRVNVVAKWLAIVILGFSVAALPPLLAWFLAIVDEKAASLGVLASFVVSLYTLEATIVVALGVYHLQKSHARRSNEVRVAQAKEVLCWELETCLEGLLLVTKDARQPGAGFGLKDATIRFLPELRSVLTPESFRRLTVIAGLAQEATAALHDEDYPLHTVFPGVEKLARSWVGPLLLSRYAALLANVDDFHMLLDKRTFDLLHELALLPSGEGRNTAYVDNLLEVRDRDGRVIASFDLATGFHRVWQSESLLCDGRLEVDELSGEYEIVEGFVRKGDYVGHIKNGEPGGMGYRLSVFGGHKLSEGEWRDGNLVEGIEYGWVIVFPDVKSAQSENGEYEKCFQLGQSWAYLSMLEDRMEYDDPDCFRITDIRVCGEHEYLERTRMLPEIEKLRAGEFM